ncbi:MAG: hypothetical protein IJB86_05540 [Clostridia bacterium]|nr:hypothetical protein [Clostridia bacterium]
MADVRKKKKSKLKRSHLVFITAVCVVLLSVFVYEIYTLSNKSVETVTAYEETVYDSLEASAFVIRDEEVISGSIGGYSVPFAADGEKISSNAQIAISFDDETSAENYAKSKQLKGRYDRYKQLSDGAQYSVLKVESLTDSTKQEICAFISSTSKGDIAGSTVSAESFIDSETAIDIAINGNVDFSENMLSLEGQIKTLDAATGNGTVITTGIDASGYYFSTTDGLESEFSFADVKKIKPADVEKALEKEAVINESSAGKVIKSHVWYIAFTADLTTSETLTKRLGKSVRVEFPGYGTDSVNATVYSVNNFGTKQGVVILKCTTVNEDLLALRQAEISVILSEKTGFKVPSSAVRIVEKDGEKVRGVYVLRGNVVNFRQINAVYSGEDFILSEPTTDSGYIALYDEIITGGKELHDGAVVYQ